MEDTPDKGAPDNVEDTPYSDLTGIQSIWRVSSDNQKKYSLRRKHIQALADEEVSGLVFLALTREDLRGDPYHLEAGAARDLVELSNSLEKTQRTFPPATIVALC